MSTIFDQHPDFDPSRINKGFEETHLRLEESYIKLYEALHRVPTIKEISADCGLASGTITKHLKEMRLSDVTPKQKVRLQRILNSLAIEAEKGNIKAIELYLSVIGGWIRKQEIIDPTGKTVKVVFADSKDAVAKQIIEQENDEGTDEN